jgi:hypothetical protein
VSRAAGAVGLSFVEAVAKGRYVTYGVSKDVERAYRNIERDYPRLRCAWDQENKEHMIVEHCADGEHRLVLNSKHFMEDLIRSRLERANSLKFDPMDEIEQAERDVEAAHDKALHEAVGAAGEKLAHAFAADGLTVRPRMTPRSVAMRKKRTLPNFEAPTRGISNR